MIKMMLIKLLKYYCNRKKIHPFLTLKENGIEKTITKKNLKQLYKKHCIDDKNNYKYVRKKGVWEIV